MSINNHWMISSSYDFQAHQQRSQTRYLLPGLLYCDSRCWETCRRRSQVLPGWSLALPVTLKASRNDLLGSDTLLKLTHASLHSTSLRHSWRLPVTKIHFADIASPWMLPKNLQPLSPSAGSIWKLFQMGLPPENRPMHFVEKPSHPLNFVPVVERTVVGMHHHVGKLDQGEFGVHQPGWGLTSAPPKSDEVSLSSSAS